MKGDGGLSIVGVASCLLLFIFGYYVGREPDTDFAEQSYSNNVEPLYTISTMSMRPVVPAVARKMGKMGQRRSPTALSAFSKPPVPEENFNKNFFFDIFKKDNEQQSGGGGGGKGSGFYSFSANDINGKKVDFSKYKGKVSLVVNVASE